MPEQLTHHGHGHGHHHDHDHDHDHAGHGHSHGLVDRSIVRSREGVRAVSISLAVLGATALVQTLIFASTGSVALLADVIHNFGDALTAIPLGIAFFLGSARGEKLAGLAVVGAIFISACVALYETIQRLVHPQHLSHLWVLALAGVVGFIGNELAARVRLACGTAPRQPGAGRRRQPCAGRRLRLARRGRERCRRRPGRADRRPADRPRDHARHPQGHLGLVADRLREPRLIRPERRDRGAAYHPRLT